MFLISVNGRLVPENRAVVSVFDHGFLYGDGVYETLVSSEGIVFRFEDHLARLRKSAGMIRLRLPYGREEFVRIVYETLKANRLSDAYIRITVSRGPGQIGLDPSLCPSPTVIVIARPFVPRPERFYREGVKVIISSVRRNCKEALNPSIKSLNFLNNILAKIEAVKKGAFEALMLNTRGFLTEGTISNLFIIRKEKLLTPSLESGVLDGVTRRIILKIACKSGIATKEKSVSPPELYGADEVFLTNTLIGVLPVGQADHVKYRRREITSFLGAEYRKAFERSIRRRKEKGI